MIAMGKRRDSSERYYADGGGDATVGKGCAGIGSTSASASASKSGKFSVFEFDDVDMRVETESRKTLAKFGSKSPNKKATHFRRPLDKYLFLANFARGDTDQQNHCESEMSRVDTTDLECSPCGANSHVQEKRDSGGFTSGRNPNKVVYVFSDEDECMELKSPTSSSPPEDEDLLHEQSSDYDKNSKHRDCVQEDVVVVGPQYVKYGNRYYTSCLLIFSRSWIRLEGPALCDRNISYRLWPIIEILKIECQQCESVGADVINLLFQSTDMSAAETENKNSGCVELEFVVLNGLKWSKTQDEIKSLDLRYKAAWKTITSVCSFESFEDIIYPDGDPDAVLISRGDLELLQPRTFINDTLIDFYVKYLLTKTKPEELHRFHFFNTFFFTKLVDMDRDSCRTWDGREAYQCVRKWTKNVNLFEKDYVFMPVNFRLHWSLIVICHPGEVANLNNSMNDSCKLPCILHMDSIRGSHRGLENLIRSYLWEEWKERSDKDNEHLAKKFLNLDFFAPQLPQQENLFDCGLFLLHYAELFLKQALKIENFDFLNKDWFHPAEVSLKKRDHIRNLIHRIVEDKSLRNPSAKKRDHIRNLIHRIVEDKSLRNPSAAYEDRMIEGDDSELFVQANESHHDVKSHSHDECYVLTERQQSADFIADESCHQDKQPVPINQFSNMRLPVEEGVKKSRYGSDGHNNPVDSDWACEMKASWESSATCSKSPVKQEHCVPGTGEQERYHISSTSSEEDLTRCIVEDSEEECVLN